MRSGRGRGRRPKPPASATGAVPGRDGERAREMVPRAVRTHLNDIAREHGWSLRELEQLRPRGDAAPVGRQPAAEHVGDRAQVVALADRALVVTTRPDVAGGPDELGMGVTDVLLREPLLAVLAEQGVAGQPVV